MLLSYFDYIFVHLKQISTSQARIKPEILSTLGPNSTRKAPRDLQLWTQLQHHIEYTKAHMTDIFSFALINEFFLRGATERNTR